MTEAISAGDASAHFLNAIEPEKARDERPEIERFVDWIGAEREMGGLTGEEIDAYLRERFPDALGGADDDAEGSELDETAAAQIEPLRAFLAYASRLAFTEENLVPHLRLGERAGGARGGAGAAAELGGKAYYVTLEGVAALPRQSRRAALGAFRGVVRDALDLFVAHDLPVFLARCAGSLGTRVAVPLRLRSTLRHPCSSSCLSSREARSPR